MIMKNLQFFIVGVLHLVDGLISRKVVPMVNETENSTETTCCGTRRSLTCLTASLEYWSKRKNSHLELSFGSRKMVVAIFSFNFLPKKWQYWWVG